jgi:hypothetical protein
LKSVQIESFYGEFIGKENDYGNAEQELGVCDEAFAFMYNQFVYVIYGQDNQQH